ncbi:hypothetical protein [Mucilaginibacter agri]|uniref:Uncharacterized protein n=1 Tax=Mucilaginibacter agri TaxID=2695265 RepID=A0A966DRA7_9SPHI|nr:hypothetical protein [Mucilaginibacter agri]NCD68290.1 hypothetical protein [Mucilaginibacter agri]
MKKVCLWIADLIVSFSVSAQQYVIDPKHLIAVLQNGVVRSSAESAHDQYLGKITNNINNLNTNVGSVFLAQTIIYKALANVNSALKDGLEVKNMAFIISDMTGYISQALEMAKTEPYLLVFAGNLSVEMRTRSLALVNDVSNYILKDGDNVLADYNSRDQLLHRVTRQLQILDGLAYGAWKAMYWARERGVIASLNPFAGYINTDEATVARVIQNARYLRE